MAIVEIKPGYGDEECLDCDTRLREPTQCKMMVLFTEFQIAHARTGDIETSGLYEHEQNKIATKLLCKPGIRRI